MAQQLTFKQYPGHHLGDVGIGPGFFKQLLDEGCERACVVTVGFSHGSLPGQFKAAVLCWPSTRRWMPSGLAFFRGSGSSASGTLW
ncbi:hypothetical protein D3C76_948470 [compost metagenome]